MTLEKTLCEGAQCIQFGAPGNAIRLLEMHQGRGFPPLEITLINFTLDFFVMKPFFYFVHVLQDFFFHKYLKNSFFLNGSR